MRSYRIVFVGGWRIPSSSEQNLGGPPFAVFERWEEGIVDIKLNRFHRPAGGAPLQAVSKMWGGNSGFQVKEISIGQETEIRMHPEARFPTLRKASPPRSVAWIVPTADGSTQFSPSPMPPDITGISFAREISFSCASGRRWARRGA